MATTIVTNGKASARNTLAQGAETQVEIHFKHLSKDVKGFEGLKAAVQLNPTDENIYGLLVAVEKTIKNASLLRHDTAHVREANTVH